jgi:D-serine deaminase-like pyridoxal phosphate-dependent protein
MRITDLKTPCAVIDLDRLEVNATRLADKAHRLGVRLRPHIKTHKSVDAARIQTRGHFGGITVSTLAEAHGFADAGFTDITWAVPVALDRLDECVGLAQRLDRFRVVLDHPHTLAEMERYASEDWINLPALLEVDCGYHRTGVDPESGEAVALAHALKASPLVAFEGILTHAGHAYNCRTADEVLDVARQERDVMVGFAERLRAAGIEVGEVSVGSSPTFAAVDDLTGVTEVRPGNSLLFDIFQAAIGSCSLDDVAMSVMARVIGVYPDRRELVINAGGLALSRDPGPTHVAPDCGYGLVVVGTDQKPIRHLKITSLSQEHGRVRSDRPLEETWQPGTPIRILPNHACLAAACYDRLFVVRGDEVVDEWKTIRGW